MQLSIVLDVLLRRPTGKGAPRALTAASFAAVSLLLLWHSHVYARFLSDDALISLRYARRLVEGHGLTWTGGERVEGYTDFLWVLLTAAGGWMRCDYVSTALALDRLGVVLAVAMVGVSPRTGAWSAARLIAGGGLLAATIPMAVWGNGGLEHGFMTGVLALGLYLLQRDAVTRRTGSRWVAGVPFAALALLRADGVLLGVLAFAGAFVADALDGTASAVRQDRGARAARRAIGPVLVLACAVTAQLAFRRFYYGAWQPNTALAKLAFNRDRLLLGLAYVQHGYHAVAVMLVVALVATVVLKDRVRPAVVISWTVIAGWSAYLVLVGGDIFPGWRQLVFVMVPLAMLAGELAEPVAETFFGRPRWMPLAAIAATGVVAWGHYAVQRTDSENRRAEAERWEWDGLGVAAVLKKAFSHSQPLLAVDAAGALPYWSDLPSLDMLGLNDSYIARHPPPSFGHGQIGHELGDGAYVLRRAPDLVAFNGSTGFHEPLFLSGRQLVSTPEFLRLYQWIRVEPDTGTRAPGEIWVRREGSALGIVRSADRIEVPGYFVTGPRSETAARLGAQGSLVVEATERRFGVLPEFDVPAGCWALGIDPPSAEARAVGFRCGSRSMQPNGEVGTTIELQRQQAIGIAVAPALGGASHTTIERLVLTRTSNCEQAFRCLAAGDPLVLPGVLLSRPRPERLPWDHPSNVVIGREGMIVRVEARQRLRRIQIGADDDDRYALDLRRGGNGIWRGEIDAAYNGGGLAIRAVDLAEDLLLEKGDELLVSPLAGDGRYSVGHLILEE